MTNYINTLKDWNFWEKVVDSGIARPKHLDVLLPWAALPEIVAVTGVRRSGKSTILLQLLQELHRKKRVPYRNTLYINFEDPRLENCLHPNGLFELVAEYRRYLKPKGRIYIVLDEIQRVSDWEKFCRTIYDQKENIKLFVTGSTSRTFTSDLSHLLSGRIIIHAVTPLDFQEFMHFRKGKGDLDEYLQFGGFPRVVLEENEVNKTTILVSYYDTIIENDVILKNDIKNKTELKHLAHFALSNIANQISSYSLEKVLHISNENISRYLNFLEESFIIARTPIFSYSVKKQIYNPDKIYCIDTGLAKVAGFSFSENKGKFVENVVFQKLRDQAIKLFYWKNGTEIDLITFANNHVDRLINVTLTVDDPDVLRRELSSLAKGKNEFSQAEELLLTVYNQSHQTDKRIQLLTDFLLK